MNAESTTRHAADLSASDGARTGGALIELLVATAHVVALEIASGSRRAGLSPGKVRLLRSLAQRDTSMRLTDLANAVGCSRSNVTQLVQRLAREDLVEAQAFWATRGSRFVLITPKGRERVAGGHARDAGAAEALAAILPADEQSTLFSLLERLRRGVAARGVRPPHGGGALSRNPWLDPYVAREVQDIIRVQNPPEPRPFLNPEETGIPHMERVARTLARNDETPIEEAREFCGLAPDGSPRVDEEAGSDGDEDAGQ